MEPNLEVERINKEQEKAIMFFYHYLVYREVKIDADILDDFFDWVFEKKENNKLLDEMKDLSI